mgnify:CR=1 FL=1
MKKVIVVIPTHKEKLSLGERVSLAQVAKVLHKHPKVFVVPKSSSADFAAAYPDFGIVHVKDEWFGTIQKYTAMCLDPQFYKLFSNYEYLLIYQLDAFVFSDQLDYFCSLGYDYIGSPWPWLRRSKSRGGQSVGIGGFSLRKVQSCIRAASLYGEVADETGIGHVFETAEDRFYGYCGKSQKIRFSVPSVSIAAKFSLDIKVGHFYDKLTHNNLPFGCHGWTKKSQFELWRPFVEPYIGASMGLIADEVSQQDSSDYNTMIMQSVYAYFLERIMRRNRDEVVQKVSEFMPLDAVYICWGYGGNFDQAKTLCRFLPMKIVGVYDRKMTTPVLVDGCTVKLPDEQEIRSRQYKILITTKKYEQEISRFLEDRGLHANEDFFSFQKMKEMLVNKFYRDWHWMGWHKKLRKNVNGM